MFQLRSGRLQRETSVVDRSQAAIVEALELVKEIGLVREQAVSRCP